MKVLIPGIAGRVAQRVALKLRDAGHTVQGVDSRSWVDAPADITVHPVDVRKRAAEEVFRRFRPDAVVHMGTVTHLFSRGEDQFRINLGSTRAVFEHCRTYEVAHAIFVGRHTFYGAAPDSPLYHREDEPPLEVTSFPELADLVAADLFAGSALWRHPSLCTTVLRVCYTLGPARHGTLAQFLSRRRVPTVLGFDPLFQFLHEDDVAQAVALSVDKKPRGVFNVAGPAPVPLSVLIRATGRSRVPVPEPFFRAVLGRFGLPSLPPAALNHIKFPVLVDSRAFAAATGFAHAHDEERCVADFVSASPIG